MKVKKLRFVWLITLAIGGTAVFVFVNDTRHAYADMLESMKRYAADNPNFVVEQEVGPSSEIDAIDTGVQVTRQGASDLTSISPAVD